MKKQLKTPRSQVRSAIRKVFLRSREHALCLKNANYSCAKCGKKQSKAKGREVEVCVHHHNGIDNWNKVIDMIYEDILCSSDKLECLCKDCHDKVHGKGE